MTKNKEKMNFSQFKHFELCQAADDVMQLTTSSRRSKRKLLEQIENCSDSIKKLIGESLRKTIAFD